jgi:hypothetical protein
VYPNLSEADFLKSIIYFEMGNTKEGVLNKKKACMIDRSVCQSNSIKYSTLDSIKLKDLAQ